MFCSADALTEDEQEHCKLDNTQEPAQINEAFL